MRKIYWALFVVLLVVVSIWLAVHYDVLTLARAFLAPAWRWLLAMGRVAGGPVWQWLTVASRPLAENYLMRRAEAPLWGLLMDGALALVGYKFAKRMVDRIRSAGTHVQRGMGWWRTQPRLLRWGVGSTLVFCGGFLGFGLFILPVWVPVSGRLMQSVHFFWFDKVMARWISPMQRRFRHTMRTNPFWRIARIPHRFLMYWALVGVRRSARGLRHAFGHLHKPRAAPAPVPTIATANLAEPGPRP